MHTLSLGGDLTQRGARPLGDYCAIDRAMQVIGQRTTILLLREAFYGERRFDGFAARTGMTEAAAAKRLKELVENGVMTREPYQEPGQRTRFEYQLTEKGAALLPALLALLQWGNAFVEPGEWSEMQLVHESCGAAVHVVPQCTLGHVVQPKHLIVSATRTKPEREPGQEHSGQSGR